MSRFHHEFVRVTGIDIPEAETYGMKLDKPRHDKHVPYGFRASHTVRSPVVLFRFFPFVFLISFSFGVIDVLSVVNVVFSSYLTWNYSRISMARIPLEP